MNEYSSPVGLELLLSAHLDSQHTHTERILYLQGHVACFSAFTQEETEGERCHCSPPSPPPTPTLSSPISPQTPHTPFPFPQTSRS